ACWCWHSGGCSSRSRPRRNSAPRPAIARAPRRSSAFERDAELRVGAPDHPAFPPRASIVERQLEGLRNAAGAAERDARAELVDVEQGAMNDHAAIADDLGVPENARARDGSAVLHGRYRKSARSGPATIPQYRQDVSDRPSRPPPGD